MTRYELDTLIESLSLEGVNPDILKRVANMIPQDILAKEVVPGIAIDDVETIFADGFADSNAFVDVDYDEDIYKQAKVELEANGISRERMTIELVQAMMVYQGHHLVLTDQDGDKHAFGRDELARGVDLMLANVEGKTRLAKIEKMFDDGDFFTFEGIIQYGIYGEIVYG